MILLKGPWQRRHSFSESPEVGPDARTAECSSGPGLGAEVRSSALRIQAPIKMPMPTKNHRILTLYLAWNDPEKLRFKITMTFELSTG
jgi:hypothetical protein